MKVSIIIPVYNVEKYIRRCVESLINQTHRDLEIIFVNDKTPDNSMQIVHEYASIDERIVIVNNSCNMGQMMSRKKGYELASADYLMFVDSDDDIPLNAVEMLLNAIIANDSDIVAGAFTKIYVEGTTKIMYCRLPYGNQKGNVYHALLDDVFFHNLWGKIYKSDLLKKFDYRNDENFKYGEDAALFYQIVNNAQKVSTIEKNVYNYYISIGCSSIDKLTNKHFEDRLKADRIIYDCCCKYPILKSSLSHYLMIDIIKFFYILKSPMKDINKIVKKHGFGYLITFKQIFKILSFKEKMQWLKAFVIYKLCR